MAKYMLVSFKTCPWVQRAAIVLREKKTDFEFRHIEPDNRPDWFLAISPHKKVPVLRIDAKVSLFESNAIAEYLDETIAPRLHPGEAAERAVNRAWTDYIPTFAQSVTGCAYAETEADFNKAIGQIPAAFERLETALAKQGNGRHLLGEGRHVVGPGAVDGALYRVLRMQPRRDRLVQVLGDGIRFEQRDAIVDAQHRHFLVRRYGEEPIGSVVGLDVAELEIDLLLAQHDRRPLHPGAGLEADQQIFRHGGLA